MSKIITILLASTIWLSCATTYRTTITETRRNKIDMYLDEYAKGKITEQQLDDLIMIYIKEISK
ncbi:MAG: hypothetical protein WC716_16500 [Chitinophagaceae bacterium]|jgi:hypothetical protein